MGCFSSRYKEDFDDKEVQQQIKNVTQLIDKNSNPDEEKANLLLKRAKLYYNIDELDNAITDLKISINSTEECTESLLLMANIQYDREEYQSAFETYKQLLIRKPDEKAVQYGLLICEEKLALSENRDQKNDDYSQFKD